MLVLDEPTTGIDADSQRRFRDTLVRVWPTAGEYVLLVSHELGAVADDLDRVLLLRHGRISFDGPRATCRRRASRSAYMPTTSPVWLEGLADDFRHGAAAVAVEHEYVQARWWPPSW